MIHFNNLDTVTFLKEYWQKKPLVIRNALPSWENFITPDELAGLALEEDVESRLVWETPQAKPQWHLERGPLKSTRFKRLPQSHWTLLVQGVDRLIPEIAALRQHFDFLPQWRFDDIMISFATLHGSVGPHFDYYDVFLYQALGQREWRLTTKKCHPENYISDLELRIMREFETEETFILEEGDMLYLPPHVGHYGISLSDECMTYSFGYRSYQGQELWESFGDYLAEHRAFKKLYTDPDWSLLDDRGVITSAAWKQAQQLIQEMVSDEALIKKWFGTFATQPDAEPLEEYSIHEDEIEEILGNIQRGRVKLIRHAHCRIAYLDNTGIEPLTYFVNGISYTTSLDNLKLLQLFASYQPLTPKSLQPYLKNTASRSLIGEFLINNWLDVVETSS